MEQKRMPLLLKQQVMDAGNCAGCGLCTGICPYVKYVDERVAFIHDCGLSDGTCFQVCPRTDSAWSELDQQVFQTERKDHVLGNYIDIVYARSLNPDASGKGQYGGVVSELASFLVEEGQSSAAILTNRSVDGPPTPTIARSREEVLACAGSNYSAVPSLAALNSAVKEGMNNLAVVGRPCQVLALRKMQGLNEGSKHNLTANKVNFIIGLFCFWSLETGIYDLIRTKAGNKEIRKIDIPRDFVITTDTDEIQIPIEEVRTFVRSACQTCFDPTSEFADVSVGSTENDPGWNTLIIRTKRGQEIVEAAKSSGRLETKQYPAERLPLLLSAVSNKKLRVLNGENGSADYLKLKDTYIEGIRKGGVNGEFPESQG